MGKFTSVKLKEHLKNASQNISVKINFLSVMQLKNIIEITLKLKLLKNVIRLKNLMSVKNFGLPTMIAKPPKVITALMEVKVFQV